MDDGVTKKTTNTKHTQKAHGKYIAAATTQKCTSLQYIKKDMKKTKALMEETIAMLTKHKTPQDTTHQVRISYDQSKRCTHKEKNNRQQTGLR